MTILDRLCPTSTFDPIGLGAGPSVGTLGSREGVGRSKRESNRTLLPSWGGHAAGYRKPVPSGEVAPLRYNKLCNVEDFARPELVDIIRDVFAPDIARFGTAFPRGHEYRKHWEVAMAARTLRDFGVLHKRAEVLGVGAGNEPTLFWLTRSVRRVFATDLYLGNDEWAESANASMLTDPGRHWITEWNPRRLVVQHMNALQLEYEDASFDGIFSSSSIEHFGTYDDVRRSAREMWRVLKPGGVLSLSTEYRIAGEPPGLPGILLFDAGEISSAIVQHLPWRQLDELDCTLTDATLGSEQEFVDALADLGRHREEFGELNFHRLTWSKYPHIVLRHGAHVWTSVHLALRKVD